MKNKFKSSLVVMVSLMTAMSFGIITDDFSTAQDYAADLSGTPWDAAVINNGVDATQDGVLVGLDTSSVPGALSFSTAVTNWEAAADDGGLLYMVIPANQDFDAKVLMAGGDYNSFAGNVFYHSCGLMIRNPNATAPAEIDWSAIIAFDHAHDWGFSHIWRQADNGGNVQETVGTAPLSDTPWMRLTRVGSLITAYYSADGVNWTMAGTPYDRPDLTGQVQVGIPHAVFTGSTATAILDNFSIDAGPIPYAPEPKCDLGLNVAGEGALVGTNLSWAAPSDPNLANVVSYDVYFDPNEALVAAGDASVLVADDTTSTSYDPPVDLDTETQYFWRVEATIELDDANQPGDTEVVSSALWTFLTQPENLAPAVDAGDDIVTWLVDGTVTETVSGVVVSDDGIPAAATTAWTVDPATDVTVVSETSLITDVTITAVGTYTLTLTADDTEKTGDDTMEIRVYANACEAAKAENGYSQADANARGDFDFNCIVDLNDLATLATEWLVSSEYVKP